MWLSQIKKWKPKHTSISRKSTLSDILSDLTQALFPVWLVSLLPHTFDGFAILCMGGVFGDSLTLLAVS